MTCREWRDCDDDGYWEPSVEDALAETWRGDTHASSEWEHLEPLAGPEYRMWKALANPVVPHATHPIALPEPNAVTLTTAPYDGSYWNVRWAS